MNYIGGLTGAWTAMNMNKGKINKNTKIEIPNLVIYWLLFCFSFAITYFLIMLICY